MAIRIEKNGEAAYRAAVEKISDPALVSMLEWMADEEVKHAEWFMALKRDAGAGGKNPFMQEMDGTFFSDVMGDQRFSLREVDFSKVVHVEELVEIFIEFEKDGILFYELLQPFLQEKETRGTLNKIIEEEKRHIAQLKEFAEASLSENGG